MKKNETPLQTLLADLKRQQQTNLETLRQCAETYRDDPEDWDEEDPDEIDCPDPEEYPETIIA